MLPGVAEQHVDHQFLDGRTPIEINAGKGTDHVLSDYGEQLLIAEVLIPRGLIRLRQRIVLQTGSGGRGWLASRIGVVLDLQVLIVGTMGSPLGGPGLRIAFQYVEQSGPGNAAEFGNLQMAGNGYRSEMRESGVFADGR